MKPLDLNELRELHAASTSGEWVRVGRRIYADGGKFHVLDMHSYRDGKNYYGDEADATDMRNGDSVIAAHNAMPALLAELEALRKEAAEHEYYLDRLTEQVQKYLGEELYSLSEGIDGLGERIAELEGKLELASLALSKREPEPQTVTIGGSSEC